MYDCSLMMVINLKTNFFGRYDNYMWVVNVMHVVYSISCDLLNE